MTRAVCAASVIVLGASGCSSESVDTHEVLAAHSLGLLHLQRGQLPEAEAQFRKVTSLARRDPGGYANLGLTYLRGGRFREAETQLRRAHRLNDKSAEVGLILARLYALTGRAAEARRTLEALPRDARVLYAIAELDTAGISTDTAALRRYQNRLSEVQRAAPANLAVRLQLADVLARRGLADSAAERLEEVRRFRPEPPAEARPHLDSTLRLLRHGNLVEARGPLDRFLRAMELTPPYQSSLDEIKWVQGPLVGRPVLAFNPQSLISTRPMIPTGRRVPEVRFTDVTDESGLATLGLTPMAFALDDYDGDGTLNLFVAGAVPTARRFDTRMYNVLGGYVADVTQQTGISLPTGAAHAAFADFDNDGWLDLFAIGGDGRGVLLRNNGNGGFADVTATARVADVGGARKALFVDLDHDGDLDLLLVGGERLRVYRNNLDGTFMLHSDEELFGGIGASGATDAAFGDFDGDGRVDLAVAKADGNVALYVNTGFRKFRDASSPSGLRGAPGSDARIAAADYDNSGTLDILVARAGGGVSLWRNSGNGTFSADRRSAAGLQSLARGALGAEFVDYDNDGWLDLIVRGARGGVSLFHNDGSGRFEDRSSILPAGQQLRSPTRGAPTVAIADVDRDGDQDVLVGDSVGVRVLRNNGGNANMGMEVQLLGMRSGGGKNNNFGIGSRLEMRTGAIYQTRVVTNRVTHFGLGPHLKADVLRVQWTNGVPETIYFPGTDADILELEQLKGSCAFLYTWDGKRFRFVTDVMWQSALGMPLGLMGGGGSTSAAYAPAGPSQEYLRIPGEALQPRNGRFVMQLTEELWETAFVDEVQLIAVDHPDSVDLYVDERFPPRGRALRTFNAAHRRPPVTAVDQDGSDVLAALREKDDIYLSNFVPLEYQGVVQPHDLVLDLGADAGGPGTTLFLRGWIFPTDASINIALSQQKKLNAVMPSLEVRDSKGRWRTAVASIGFPSGKDKTVAIDLAGLFPTSDHHVRIRTNMQIYWDQAFVGTDVVASPVRTTTMRPIAADLHFRGYSKMYRKGGRHGPHWFEYDSVSRDARWRTIEGAFTRFGDVRPLLQGPDDMYVVMAPGDEMTVEFDATAAGAPPPGWRRTFLLYTDGWIKDADLNTAFGNTVEPLPFHAIKSYPYADGDQYPTDSAHARYRKEYNSRVLRR
jgi:Tfp pilus assembly protein PilF/predicted secreted protein